MFTGIVEDIGKVIALSKKDSFVCIGIQSCMLSGNVINAGESIAVDGVCLTASGFGSHSFSAEMSPETIKKTTLASLRIGDKVNLERAVTPTTRLGGHLVSGHVDSTGTILTKQREGEGCLFFIKTDKDILKYLIKNGSVAVDGISLTVVDVFSESFTLMIVPHTSLYTTLTDKKEGDMVNIECDMIGKYVEKFVQQGALSDKRGVTFDTLFRHGLM